MTKIALITGINGIIGITGQDGAYLSEFLRKKPYIVRGIKRRSSLFGLKLMNQNAKIDIAGHRSLVGSAITLYPPARIADERPPIDLKNLISAQFGDWREGPRDFAGANPERKEALDKIYNQTSCRTYVSSNGERVMLTIALGAEQSHSMQVHRPEICYPAQGSKIVAQANTTFDKACGVIPLKRAVSVLGSRNEPAIYSVAVGDWVAIDKISWKLAQLKITLTGKVPDGLIFRVSTLGKDENSGYAVQDRFVRDLPMSMAPEKRRWLIGGVG